MPPHSLDNKPDLSVNKQWNNLRNRINAIGPAIAMAMNQGNICQMQYAIAPNDAIAGMKNNRRKYLRRDVGFADFSSMFEVF